MTAPAQTGLVMIRVLGPIDLLTEQGVVPVSGRNGRILLAALVVSANHAVSSDHLAQVVWGDNPPPSRDNTLQTYVSRLRHLMGHDSIVAEEHSYELHVTPNQLDALRFESRVVEAEAVRSRPEDCLMLCKEALSLWRGPAFGELADRDPFRLEAIRLDELRLFAMELKLECDLALGRHEMVVGTLEALVQEYPYNEHLWYLLIAALSRSGRRVEALRAFQHLRAVLAEVGLEPTVDMRQLEEQIVTEDPGVRPRLRPSPGPGQEARET